MYDLCAGTAGASLRLGVFHYEARSKEEERKNEKYSDKIEFSESWARGAEVTYSRI